LGWVSGLRRTGSKLIADLANVPRVMRDLITSGRYRRVSSEIYPAWDATTWEKTLKSGVTGPVLSAVAYSGPTSPK